MNDFISDNKEESTKVKFFFIITIWSSKSLVIWPDKEIKCFAGKFKNMCMNASVSYTHLTLPTISAV